MISYSFLLLLIGMGTVFLFLLLLVGSMNLLEKLTVKPRQRELDAKKNKSIPKKSLNLTNNEDALMGVIAGAIHAHRSRA